LTLDAVSSQSKTKFNGRIFQTGQSFEIGDVEVETFSIPHDAQDPVGFLIRTHHGNVGFLTDLGHATRLVLDRVRPAQALILETNYDLQLLQEDTKRPWSIKQRITSRHGHLSNHAAGEAARELVSDQLRHIFMAHLSKDCNDPSLAQRTVQQEIDKTGARHIKIHRTQQDTPCPTLDVSATTSAPTAAETKTEAARISGTTHPAPEPISHTSKPTRAATSTPEEEHANEQQHASFFDGLQASLKDDPSETE